MKSISLTIFLLFGLNQHCLSQSATSDLILLKNGKSINCQILSLEENTLRILSDGPTNIMLRVIESIQTQNEQIVSILRDHVPNLVISRENDLFTISFSNATIPIKSSLDHSWFTYKSITVFFITKSMDRVGFLLSAKPYWSSKHIFNFEANMGDMRSEYPIGFLNLGMGFGLNQQISQSEIRILLNYGVSNYFDPKIADNKTENVIYISGGGDLKFDKFLPFYLTSYFAYNLGLLETSHSDAQKYVAIGISYQL